MYPFELEGFNSRKEKKGEEREEKGRKRREGKGETKGRRFSREERLTLTFSLAHADKRKRSPLRRERLR